MVIFVYPCTENKTFYGSRDISVGILENRDPRPYWDPSKTGKPGPGPIFWFLYGPTRVQGPGFSRAPQGSRVPVFRFS